MWKWVWVVVLLEACGPRGEKENAEKGVPLIRREVEATAGLFGRVEYNPPLGESMDQKIRELVQQRYFGRYPAGEAEAKQMAFVLAPRIWGTMLDGAAGRAAFAEKMRAYWENPRVEEVGGGVGADLGVCPGPIEKSSKGIYTVDRSEAMEGGELRAGELVKRLEGLRARYPGAKYYWVKVACEMARRAPIRMRYEYWPGPDELRVSFLDGRNYVSPEPVGKDLRRLERGEAPVRTADLEPVEEGRR
jgi:hypothetical protein